MSATISLNATSAASWENSRGYRVWRDMPAAKRQAEESRTLAMIAGLLEQPSRGPEFPNWPVYHDGAELSWSICQEAMLLSERAGPGGSAMVRWMRALPHALAQQARRERAFLRGDAQMPPPFEPDRHNTQDHAALRQLVAPLVLGSAAVAAPLVVVQRSMHGGVQGGVMSDG